MTVTLIPVLVVLALALVLVLGVMRLVQRQDRRVDEAERSTTATLRYRVPEGQDPTAVLTSLREAGYEPVTEGDLVVVPVLADTHDERERVRGALQHAGTGLEAPAPPGNPVRFVDE
jgi:hypothetical protein